MREFILFGHLLENPVVHTEGDLTWATMRVEADRDWERPRRFVVKAFPDPASFFAEDHRKGDSVFARGELDVDESGQHFELIAQALCFLEPRK